MKSRNTPKKSKVPKVSEEATGTYAFDKELGKVVKVSDSIPKVASHGKGASGEAFPCGARSCPGGGPCTEV